MSNQSIVARYFDEMCNARQLDAAAEIFAPGHSYHDPSSPWVGPGPEGMQQLVSAYQSAFPDAHWQVEEMIVADESVVARWTGTGTHRGELSGIAPTGRSVNVAGVWIFRLSGGKVAESWNVWDTFGMMQQLGVAPAVGRAGAA